MIPKCHSPGPGSTPTSSPPAPAACPCDTYLPVPHIGSSWHLTLSMPQLNPSLIVPQPASNQKWQLCHPECSGQKPRTLLNISSDFSIYQESNHFSLPPWPPPLSPSSHPYPTLSVPPTAARGIFKNLSRLVPPLPRSPMAATSFREAQLTMAHKALPSLPWPITAVTFSLLPLCSFHSSLTGLLVIPQTHQTGSHLRTFALVPST